MLLWQEAANELAAWCCTSTSRDYQTVSTRVKHEGISFLTITLPDFCKDFQKSLAEGQVDRNQFQGFAFSGSLPRFLGGFFDLVFDRGTGRLVENPSIDAIFAIRQLTLMFGKVAIACSEERVAAAIEGYLNCEQSVKESDNSRGLQEIEDFSRVSNLLWNDLFNQVDRKIALGEILPKHGPGATADRLTGNGKYNQTEWTRRLEDIFPAAEFLLPNWNYIDSLNSLNWLEPGAERPVRVITVPKTLKTPRIIAIEPTAMQYAQQAVLEAFTECIDADDNARAFIRWKSNVPNQRLARRGSLTGSLATLDLSEASDRVSNQLVREMFFDHPILADAVDACRSRKAEVPYQNGKKIIRLAKFASMGSALCFPMESLVFMTVMFLGIEDVLNRPLTKEDVESFKGQVRVYGDDIIIPVEYVRSVVSRLETFGFKVNANKSYWSGYFRESCGKDYYAGHDVSVVRVRQLIPTRPSSVPMNKIEKSLWSSQIISTVSLRNQLYKRGLWQTVKYLDTILEGLIPFPAVGENSPVLGKHNFSGFETGKMCSDLQVPLVRGYKTVSKLPDDHLEGAGALLKFFLKRSEEPFVDRNHLERYGRPDAVDIKLGWAPAQ